MVADSQKNKHRDAAAAQYLKNKYQSAQWFVNAIRQRESTMLRIMKAIVNMQYDYFREGDIKLLKPMILKKYCRCGRSGHFNSVEDHLQQVCRNAFWNDPAQGFVHRRHYE